MNKFRLEINISDFRLIILALNELRNELISQGR